MREETWKRNGLFKTEYQTHTLCQKVDELQMVFAKPQNPLEVCWDVYSTENMLSPELFEGNQMEDYEKAVCLQDTGKKAKKKKLGELMEMVQRRRLNQ